MKEEYISSFSVQLYGTFQIKISKHFQLNQGIEGDAINLLIYKIQRKLIRWGVLSTGWNGREGAKVKVQPWGQILYKGRFFLLQKKQDTGNSGKFDSQHSHVTWQRILYPHSLKTPPESLLWPTAAYAHCQYWITQRKSQKKAKVSG